MAEETRAGTLGSTQGAKLSTASSTGNDTIVGRVRDQATSQLNIQKNKATDGLGSVAQAVRNSTERLRQEHHETVARYVEQAADQIERFSTRLKDIDVGELLSDAQRLARRQPLLFVGGAFAVGLLSARFLKSSAQHDNDWQRRYGAVGRLDIEGANAATNAYDNRVPQSAAAASSPATGTRTTARSRSTSTSRDPGYEPTEGM